MLPPVLRVAVGGISQEANDFAPGVTDLRGFREAGFLAEGAGVFELRDSGTEIAGALARLAAEPDVEIVPLLAARGISPGRVSAEAYDHLLGGLLARLRDALPVDGVYLFLHGSMEAGTDDDPEGTIAAAVREIADVPLVLSCDLHANVTRRMVERATAVVGYEQYPHDDVYETGVRSADLLLRTVRGEVAPVTAHAKVDMILTAFHSSTREDTPYARLVQRARALERRPGILSASVFLVGSYIDTPDMGCSVVVVADGDRDLAVKEARSLALAFWDQRTAFDVETVSVAEAVRRGGTIDGGPVLLLDTADTTGGGGAGDGVGLLRGLLEAGVREDSLALVVDAPAAAACHETGTGRELELSVGHVHDGRWGEPLGVRGRVERLLDGRFRYEGGIFGGLEVSMGPSAVLAIGSIRLLIMSEATYDWADEQYRAAGLDPASAKFVGVKNMMNFRFGYRDVMRGHFVLDLPGPTPPDMRQLPFARIKRPMFPLDRELADPGLRIATSLP
jgi:microcystin degradation protein MlrC